MTAECPVCGERVDDTVPTAAVDHEGETYYFESAKCKDRFKDDPSEYA